MIKEIAVADAYGAGFEFASAEKIALKNNLSGYLSHELYRFTAKYTDDTQMTIAIAEMLLSESYWSDEEIAASFVRCFKRDPREGYSKGLYSILNKVDSGKGLLNAITPTSDRNGAAMRSVPIGFLNNKSDVIQFAEKQAAITHKTEVAIKSSCAVALAAHFALHLEGKLSELMSFLKSESLANWNFNWSGRVSVSAYDTVSAAFSCLINNDNLKDLLKRSVSLGGDTDSVASIAVGLASCFEEYNKNLPKKLIDSLDEILYGVDFLEKLDIVLRNKFIL